MADVLFSSAISDVEYDELTEDMTVTFKDGSTYTYENVPMETYSSLLSAGSTGQYFNYNVRNAYSFR